jgi:Helix-turn-helix domain
MIEALQTLGVWSLDEAVKEDQAAQFLGYSKRTMQAWRVRGIGPRFIKPRGSRAVRYRPRDLIEFQNENVVRSTTEADNRRSSKMPETQDYRERRRRQLYNSDASKRNRAPPTHDPVLARKAELDAESQKLGHRHWQEDRELDARIANDKLGDTKYGQGDPVKQARWRADQRKRHDAEKSAHHKRIKAELDKTARAVKPVD